MENATEFTTTENLSNYKKLLCGEEMFNDLTNVTTNILSRHATQVVSEETLYTIKIIFGMVLLLPVSFLGIVGNIVSLSVLRHHKGKSASIYCLIALSTSDLLLLMNALLFSTINIYVHLKPTEGTNFRNSLFPYFGIYASLVTARITSVLTTLLSIERFVAVYFPMKAKFVCNKTTTLFAIIIIYLITIVLFLPFPFKYNVVNMMKNNVSLTVVVRNPNLSETFCQLYGIIMNCLFRFSPILLILVLNISIMYIVHKTGKQRESLTSPTSESQSQEQRKITIMLMVVSFTFLFCILPGAINSLLQTTWKGYSRLGKSKNFQQSFSYITFFLEAVNSAVNFIIYMALSARFRANYREMYYSAKTFIREVSIRSRSSYRKKLVYQSSFTYSEEHQRQTNRPSRNGSCKSLLCQSGNTKSSGQRNSTDQPPNGVYELTENNKSSTVLKDISEDLLKESGNSYSNGTTRLAKQDTLDTSVDGF